MIRISSWPSRARALVQSRAVHFLVVGSVIFALAPAPESERDIHISSEQLAAMRAMRARQLGVPELPAHEAREVELRAVEDELLYREALRLGIGEGDAIVRQRLIQKLLFLAEEMGGASRAFTETELAAYFARTQARWRRPAWVRLVHIVGSSPEELAALRPRALAWSADPARAGEVPPLGQSFPLGRMVVDRVADVAADYGAEFADAVARLEAGTWSEPIRSRHGWHLVRVLEHQEERPAALEDVRSEVELEYVTLRRQQAVQRYLTSIFARYDVYLDGQALRSLSPTGRVAARSAPSGED